MSKRISQREARRLRKRVEELEHAIAHQRRAWSQVYIGGVEIAHYSFDTSTVSEEIRVARKLHHAVVAVGDESDTVRFVALPQPKV